jgi:hypothetical protein
VNSTSEMGLESTIQYPEQPNRLNSGIHFNSTQFKGAKQALTEFITEYCFTTIIFWAGLVVIWGL